MTPANIAILAEKNWQPILYIHQIHYLEKQQQTKTMLSEVANLAIYNVQWL